jgi:SAM-dependent methyltransferase
MTVKDLGAIYDAAADFGALYDEVPAYASRPDVAFYAAEAARYAPGGDVLDLGCGTGRLLLPLARAGHRVTGVDASPAMLARCRDKLSVEPAAVRERATLHEADVRAFSVPLRTGSGFGLVMAPFRIVQHLLTTDDQLRCLARVKQHLAPSGRFVFDVFNPHFALMVKDRSAEAEDAPERELSDGRLFRRTARVLRVRWTEQVSEVELIYYVTAGGKVTRTVQSFEMRWYTSTELEHLLARAGFAVEALYGDFNRGALHDAAPEMVVVARKS